MFYLSNTRYCQQCAHLDSAARKNYNNELIQHSFSWAVIERGGGFVTCTDRSSHSRPKCCSAAQKKKLIIWRNKPFTKPQDASDFRFNWRQRAKMKIKRVVLRASSRLFLSTRSNADVYCGSAVANSWYRPVSQHAVFRCDQRQSMQKPEPEIKVWPSE